MVGEKIAIDNRSEFSLQIYSNIIMFYQQDGTAILTDYICGVPGLAHLTHQYSC